MKSTHIVAICNRMALLAVGLQIVDQLQVLDSIEGKAVD